VAEPTTSVLLEGVFPHAVIVPLQDRGDAVRRLRKDVADPEAIDAYVSTEILLRDVLRINLAEVHDVYSIEPPSRDGFARQHVGLVVYNAPDLLKYINQWIDSDASAAARARLRPETDYWVDALTWLNRSSKHVETARVWGTILLLVFVGLCGLMVLGWLWRKNRGVKTLPEPVTNPLNADEPPDVPELEPVPPAEPAEDVLLVPAKHSLLSRRETEVLRLLAQGKQSGEIARLLGIETKTVEAHRQNLRAKLGLRNTADLTRYAIENNI
jgi:DNA-binding CsgD family transcriptional regulator